MARRRTILSRRSPMDWGFRALLAITLLWLGYSAVSHTLAYAIRRTSPERAYKLSPGDAQIAAALAVKLSGPDASDADRARSDQLARSALRREPTAVAAVATLGLNAQVRGETALTRRYFSYAQKLSRRNLRTQIWAIEDAVARDDIPGTLRNYDIALRTSRTAADLMYPVLASAIADPSIRTALVRTLAGTPPWGTSFLDYAAGKAPDPVAVAQLFRALAKSGIPVSDMARFGAVNNLVAADRFEEAWTYYASMRPQIDRRKSRDPNFTDNLSYPSVFDWMVIDEDGLSASIQRGAQGGIFDFAAPPNIGGMVLRQMQVLPPGDYILEGRSAGIDQPAASRPYWTLSCGEASELGRVVVSNGVFAGRFHVPSECRVQFLSLIVRPSDSSIGVSGQIDRILLRPAD